MQDVSLRTAAEPRWRSQMHRLPGLILLALAVYFAWESVKLGLGDAMRVGPGLWPLLICLFTAAAAGTLILIDKQSDYEPWTRRSLRLLAGVMALALFIVAFGQIGFLLPAAALMLFLLRFFAAEPWRLAIPIAFATAVCLYVIFVVALGVPFPAGPLESGL